jgi:DNA-binding NtrC family response regulator
MQRSAELAMSDVRMPDVNGLDLPKESREAVPSCDVILMTGYTAVDSTVEAITLAALGRYHIGDDPA